VCVQRKREREKKQKENRKKQMFFSFFCEKKELPPKKIKKLNKKMPWNQGPGLWCPGVLVPGFPS
jgi:hypothetical protein